jgi:hypothetical protein
MHQIFVSAPMEAGTTAKRCDASKSRVVRVLGGANRGHVVAAIGATVRQAKCMRGQEMITAYNSSAASSSPSSNESESPCSSSTTTDRGIVSFRVHLRPLLGLRVRWHRRRRRARVRAGGVCQTLTSRATNFCMCHQLANIHQ